MNEPSLSSIHSPSAEHVPRPLARRLLVWVLLISTINALLAISVQLYLDYRRDLADLEEHLGFVRASHRQGLAAAAWNFDKPLIEAQLRGLTGSPWIAAVQVIYGSNEEQQLSSGSDIGNAKAVQEYPLEFNTGPRVVQVGRLLVLPNLELIYQRTLDRALVVALTQGVKAFVFSLALLVLVHRLFTRRLMRLSNLLRAYIPGPGNHLQLVTPEDRQANDELSLLARTLEEAQLRLEDYHLKEAAQREELEAEVQRRTRHLDQALLEQQAIFDNSLTGIAFIRDRTILRCNVSFEHMFGYDIGELQGYSTRQLFPSQKAFEQEASYFTPVLRSGGTYVGDTELLHKDGKTRWFTVQFKLLDANDPDQGAVLTLHDITVRRDAEQALERLARLDGLTGLANRRTLDEALRNACRKASRERSALSLALFDVDCFKLFNDHYGHAAGDAALCAVAGVLQNATRRPYDLAARYGGEEFVLMLPGSVEPFPLLEKVRSAILDLAIPHAYSLAGELVSVSVGVVSVTNSEHCEPAALLAAADALLYQAKHDGRNRVIWQALNEPVRHV